MKGIRVLVVDDERDFVETLIKRLKMRNIDATGAWNGEDALRILDKQEVDVVVLDVRMPGMNGEDTLREIKRRMPLIQVILLTGHGSLESGIKGMKLGAFDYITKPADLDELVQKIGLAYEKKSTHEEAVKGQTIA